MSRHSYRLHHIVDLNAALPECSARGGGLKRELLPGDAPQGGLEIAIVCLSRTHGLPGLLKSVALRLVSFDERCDL
jgi:hypothetical protein